MQASGPKNITVANLTSLWNKVLYFGYENSAKESPQLDEPSLDFDGSLDRSTSGRCPLLPSSTGSSLTTSSLNMSSPSQSILYDDSSYSSSFNNTPPEKKVFSDSYRYEEDSEEFGEKCGDEEFGEKCDDEEFGEKCDDEEFTKSEEEESSEPTAGALPEYTLNDVAQHDMFHDCWIILYDKVYDVTQFLFEHPGGEDIIMEHAGRDATLAFRGVGHSKAATQSLEQYLVGGLILSERLFTNWHLR